jgi:hypothetical protein
MLMKDNKKNLASIIVSKINERGEKEESKPMSQPTDANGAAVDMEMNDVSIAADEVFAAIESKDKAGFIEAMRSMIEMCMDESESEDD